jgi:ABC-type bacteriocin/lantibiotic exporter with double-glycine peptidase domain
MLTAHEDELAELRRTSGRPARDRLVFELDEAAQRIGHDAASWQASQLTIDGTTVEAIEMTHDGWWLVLHIGTGEVADVYVFGPPGGRPTPLALQSVNEAAYQ